MPTLLPEVVTGESGSVLLAGAAIGNVGMWKLNMSMQIGKHGHSGSGGWKTRSAGTRDADATVKVFKVDAAAPDLVPGNIYLFELHINDSGNDYYEGYFMVESPGELTVDIDDGKEIAMEYSLGAHGKIDENGNVPPLSPPPTP